jgi:DNA polymerase-1
MRIALTDSDIVAYRAAILTEDQDEADAIDLIDRMHDYWQDSANADMFVPCLSVGKSFRTAWWPEYKSNRKDKPKPRHLSAAYAHIKSNPRCMWHTGWEADDVLGCLGTTDVPDLETVIVTIDKDLDQIPGHHCNPDKELCYTVDADDADMYTWMQVLSGDSTDNYPGIPRVGQEKARKLLIDVSHGDREGVVKAVYTDRGFDDSYYAAMLHCAVIIKNTEEVECGLLSPDSNVESTLVPFLLSLKPSET